MAQAAATTKIAVIDPTKRQAADRTVVARRAADAFRDADVRALKAAYYMRMIALGAIGVWLMVLVGLPDALFFLPLLAAFIVIGYAQYRAGRSNDTIRLYGLILADFLLLAFTVLTDNPLAEEHFPAAQKLHQAREAYFYILLAGVSACYDPRRVLWAGASAMIAWGLGFLWLMSAPDAVSLLNMERPATLAERIALNTDPNYIDIVRLFDALVVMAIVTGILAMVAYRARAMVRAQIASTRERANLARYFAPAVVEDLARNDAPFDAVKAQSAAVMFADVVGFTTMFQNEPPERVIGFLRALHGRLEQAIFDHGGTLDKYMGDGAMAIFGAPDAGPDDACRAIAAARTIQAAAEAWNRERLAAGEPPVALSVGVHYGPVVTGDIGSERRLEFATIGDAVNLASRLEAATRPLEAGVVISAATAAQAEAEDPERAQGLLAGFVAVSDLPIPGHAVIDAFALKR